MQKRRDRIERWRAERKRKELESAKKEVQKGSIVSNIQVPTVKKWSLEDDSGDEGEIVLILISLTFVCVSVELALNQKNLFHSKFCYFACLQAKMANPKRNKRKSKKKLKKKMK